MGSDVAIWQRLLAAIAQVERDWKDLLRLRFSDADIVRVYLWSVFSDRPMYWACRRDHWPAWAQAPADLPTQPTLSRRCRSQAVDAFLDKLGQTLAQGQPEVLLHLRKIDGKPLTVSRHSKDPDARFGRGAGGLEKGYKLHAIWGNSPMPEAAVTTPLACCEKKWPGA